MKKLAAKRPGTTLHAPLPSLAGLIARADLAIGAGGATTWERVCLKLPSLVITVAANQRPFAEALAKAGHLELLGDAATVSAEKIHTALVARIDNSAYLNQDAGGNLTDGRGLSRLSLAMLGPDSQSPRQANPSDEPLLRRWRDISQVQHQNFSPDQFAASHVQSTFSENTTDNHKLHLVATLKDGCPIGQICFDRQPPTQTSDDVKAIVDFSLDQCCLSEFGLEAELVSTGLQAMEQNWGEAIEALPEVLLGNRVSYTHFARAGFIDVPSSSVTLLDSDAESIALSPSRITLLSDSNSWLNGYLSELIQAIWIRGHAVRWIHKPAQLGAGDICFLLSCGRLLNADQLALHRHNLVVHESDLPRGQGWSPMTWQILEGESSIPITLFEATAALDAGPIYLQQGVLSGRELIEEWRALQAQKTMELCLTWLDQYHDVVSSLPQNGEQTHYRRRRPADSQLDPELSLAEQFDLLRVDNNNCGFLQVAGRSYLVNVLTKNCSSAIRHRVVRTNVTNRVRSST